jgi:hypothetical protein
MRLWENEKPNEGKPETARDYETVGFVVDGKSSGVHLMGSRLKDSRTVILQNHISWYPERSSAAIGSPLAYIDPFKT